MDKLRTINPEQLASLFRTLLQVGGAYLVAQGTFTDGQWSEISGALLVLIPTVWGFIARKDANLIRSAADVPAVKEIVAPGTSVASEAEYPKVKAQ